MPDTTLPQHGGLLLVGVGGQGVIRASDVAASALIAAGYDVKQSEVHGMAQRGGVVFSHLRYGPAVASPLLSPGGADAIVAFEWVEALRWLPYLRPGGTLVASVQRIVPPASCADRRTWAVAYPPSSLAERLADEVGDLRLVDAGEVAAGLGNAKAAGTVLLGLVSVDLDVPEAAWEEAIAARVPPRTVEANLKAFRAGRTADFPSPPDREPAPAAPGPVSEPRPVPNVEITAAWCKGCDVCVRFCPQRCLVLAPIDGALKAVLARPETCIGCRLCELLCPDFAIEVSDG